MRDGYIPADTLRSGMDALRKASNERHEVKESDGTGGNAARNMTVWDEFAKAAMNGWCASINDGYSGKGTGEFAARFGAECADAMMAERAKRQ